MSPAGLIFDGFGGREYLERPTFGLELRNERSAFDHPSIYRKAIGRSECLSNQIGNLVEIWCVADDIDVARGQSNAERQGANHVWIERCQQMDNSWADSQAFR